MRIATAQDAAAVLAPHFASATEERVVVLHLSAERELLGVTQEGEGGVGEVELPIRAILTSALRLGAEAIVVSHNHPSGDPSPSPADRDSTRRLADAARTLAIQLLDHLIFAGHDSCSLSGLGLL